MAIVDADTHVIESEATWEYFGDDATIPRPYLTVARDARTGKSRNRWVIDGQFVPKPEGRGAQALATPPVEGVETGDAGGIKWAWRSLQDPLGRVADAKQNGIGVQILYPTIFLADLTSDAHLQIALAKSYNRFMAERWETASHGFRWVIVPPLRSIDAALEELRFGAGHGAVGVQFHGIEIDRSLGDPYFHPIYELAAELNLPICVHTGPGSLTMLNLQDSRYTRNFGHNRVLPLIGFHDIIHTHVPERFPKLRIGFLEASSSWVPFMLHYLQRVAGGSGIEGSTIAGVDRAFFGPDLFEDYRLFVACEADEDIPYIAQQVGWNHLLIGSDYGHTDQSFELDIVGALAKRGDLTEEQQRLILETNPTAFYGL